MPLYVYAAAFAIAFALPYLAWVIFSTRVSTLAIRANLGTSLARPVVGLQRLKTSRRRFVPQGYGAEIQRRLDRAGVSNRMTVDRFISIKAIAVIVALVAGGALGLMLGGVAVLLMPLIFMGLVWLMPDLRLTGMANAREEAIEIQLPDVLDQMTISIEAGLGFDAALLRLTDSSEGPVTDQLSRVLQDMRLGLSRDGALKALADRTDSPDLRSFANAMAQAGRHGLAIGSVLRAQAAEARERRKFRAEERAHKVPVKILMPLVFCVLPTLFIVLIGPAVIRYTEGFG